MKATYFPKYRYTGKVATPGDQKGARGAQAGMRRGRLVDREMDMFVACQGDARKFASTLKRKPHAYTARMTAALTKLELRPVDTQTVVGDIETGFATAVDILCVDKHGEPCLVEQKCGFAGYYERSNDQMLHELAEYSNAPLNQHQLQLSLTAWLFYKTFGIRVKKAFVIRIVDTGVFFHELQQKFLNLAPVALRRMRGVVHAKSPKRSRRR